MSFLSDLLVDTPIISASRSPALTSVPVDFNDLMSGAVFFKLRGPLYATSALEAVGRGAKYVVLQDGDEEVRRVHGGAVGYVVVDDVNRAFARASALLYADTHRNLTLIGVTGTKGKTTVCHFIGDALRRAGIRAGVISSLAWRLPDSEFRAANTTPLAPILHKLLADVCSQGGTHVVLEISSIGIAEERVFGLQFDALVFTNLGTDHFEYHGSRDAYLGAKRRLFIDPSFHRTSSTLCVLNADDSVGRELASSALGNVVTYGFDKADVVPESWLFDKSGAKLHLRGFEIESTMIGRHNGSNILAAAVVIDHIVKSEQPLICMRHLSQIPGRLERLWTPLNVDVFVDYAHTPESVHAALDSLREIIGGRKLVSVIGCSGNSDKAKRPLIARAASAGSDVCILTSDNPDAESPASIVLDMLKGVAGKPSNSMKVVIDRQAAIGMAIREAMPDGVVVLMGKGTETFQLIGGQRIPHSDHAVATAALRRFAAGL